MKTKLADMRRNKYVPVDPKKAERWINRNGFVARLPREKGVSR